MNTKDKSNNINYRVMKCLHEGGPYTALEISEITDIDLTKVTTELKSYKHSLAGDVIVGFEHIGETKYYMYSEAKKMSLELLNHFSCSSISMRKNGKESDGLAKKKDLYKKILEEIKFYTE